MAKTVKFNRLDEADAEDCRLIAELFDQSRCARGHVDALFDHLKTTLGDPVGLKVDAFQHSLQTATRALRDGRPEPYVVAALFHDIGDTLSPHSHGDLAAAILKPYVSTELHFVVAHHALFQGHYFWHLDGRGRDRNARDRFREHPYFNSAVEFCELYDNPSFDPSYDTLPLHEFDAIARRVFSNPTTWAS